MTMKRGLYLVQVYQWYKLVISKLGTIIPLRYPNDIYKKLSPNMCLHLVKESQRQKRRSSELYLVEVSELHTLRSSLNRGLYLVQGYKIPKQKYSLNRGLYLVEESE